MMNATLRHLITLSHDPAHRLPNGDMVDEFERVFSIAYIERLCRENGVMDERRVA